MLMHEVAKIHAPIYSKNIQSSLLTPKLFYYGSKRHTNTELANVFVAVDMITLYIFRL